MIISLEHGSEVNCLSIARRWVKRIGRILRVALYSSAQLELMELYDLDSRYDASRDPHRSRH